MNRGVKTAADYAAIAVAPVLIFIMISSLVNFFTLVVYRGNFPERIQWTFLMVTFGSVAAARLSIEQDRSKSLTYLLALAGAAFLVLTRFGTNPVFSIGLLALIVWLSDVIVRDCTLIDDSKDSSDQGLIQSGKDGKRRGHRPGRTILFLAMAALPLFGVGQFFLRSYSGAWLGAQKLLALYLFAALSLLVTTSFLGLRRYLRQRGSEMPRNVTVAWLVGGLLMVMTILFIATLAPLPGQAIAAMEIPEWMTIKPDDDPVASKNGWGNEGTEKDSKGAAKVDSPQPKSEPKSAPTKKGAPPGAAKQGDSKTGPAGQKSGGKSPAEGDGKQKQGGSSDAPKKESQKPGQKPSDKGKPKDSDGAKQNDSTAKSDAKADGPNQGEQGKSKERSPKSPDQKPSDSPSEPKPSSPEKAKSDQSKSDQAKTNQAKPDPTGKPKSDPTAKPDPNDSSESEAPAPEKPAPSTDSENAEPEPKNQENETSQPDDSQQAEDSPENESVNDSQGEQESSMEEPPSNESTPEKINSEEDANPKEESDSDESTESNESDASSNDDSSNDSNKDPSEKPSNTESETPPEPPTPSGPSVLALLLSLVGTLLKPLILLVCLAVVGFFLWQNWAAVIQWWNSLFHREPKESRTNDSDPVAASALIPPKPFSSYTNPFQTSADGRESMIVTFAALEAFTRERGLDRSADETPSEFYQRMRAKMPDLASSSSVVIDAYNRLLYGGVDRPTAGDLRAAESLWRQMQAN